MKNVIGLAAFKEYVAVWFHQGVFINDKAGVLLNAQEGKTKGLRQWRFNSEEHIEAELLLEYIEEAISNQKKGLEIKPEKKPLILSDELKEALAADVALSERFDELTLSKRRDYAEYIAEAKRESTKNSRLEKIIPMIRAGIGLNDKYK